MVSEGRTNGRYPAPLGVLLGLDPVRALAHLRLRRQAQRTDVSYRAYVEERGTIRVNTIAKRVMAKRTPWIICSAGFPTWKQQIQFPASRLYSAWEDIAAAGQLPDAPRRVAVVPCAPLQIPA
jgi:hypothetical protein